jgi:hypothetical protein
MRAHILMIVSGIALAAPVSAEPAQAPVQKADQRAEQPVVLMAAASEVPEARPQQPSPIASAPVKPARHARVTSCRCGDQNPSE